MLIGTRRNCDTCNAPIDQAAPFYIATLPATEIARIQQTDGLRAMSRTHLSAGVDRLDVCVECIGRRPSLASLTTLIVPTAAI